MNPVNHGNDTYIVDVYYDYVENKTMQFTCNYVNVPGKYHYMRWVVNEITLEDKCVAEPYKFNDSLIVSWRPAPSSTLKCMIYVGNDYNDKNCTIKEQILTAILKQNGQAGIGRKLNSISISGLKTSNILNDNNDVIKYKFNDGDKLNITCKFQHNAGSFYIKWLKDGVVLSKINSFPKQINRLDTVIHLNKENNKSIIQCSVTENTTNIRKIHKNKIIELVYESEDEERNFTTEMTSNATDNATYSFQSKKNLEDNNMIYLIIFIIIAVIALIIIMIIIVLIIKHYKNNREKEDERTLQGNSSEINQELKCSDTYSNPEDGLTTMNNTNAVYSVPYKGVVYTTPIPKNLREVNKTEYENLRVKHKIAHNVREKDYENEINYNTTYANFDNKNSSQYSNTLCDGNNGSEMYSYIVVDK
ncbi:uncharacterized protein LOC126778874 isoform X2 [Nymphalis io]|nr:uncharacterized protein LOC126778874 isoform X2 [Nymphalis io]